MNVTQLWEVFYRLDMVRAELGLLSAAMMGYQDETGVPLLTIIRGPENIGVGGVYERVCQWRDAFDQYVKSLDATEKPNAATTV